MEGPSWQFRVKTMFPMQWCGLDPWSGTKIPHAPGSGPKKSKFYKMFKTTMSKVKGYRINIQKSAKCFYLIQIYNLY